MIKTFELESEISDIDWSSKDEFVVSTLDNNLYYYHVGNDKPMKVWRGHKSDINMVSWNWEGLILASCSEDKSAMIWSPKSD